MEQFPTLFPGAPPEAEGVGRTLSRVVRFPTEAGDAANEQE